MKFSEIVKGDTDATAAVVAATAALNTANSAEGTAHTAVVNALHSKGDSVALIQPDGSVLVYSIDAAGTGFSVATVPGDFDV
jgi:hypothetical protein